MKKTKKLLLIISIFSIFLLPQFTFAATILTKTNLSPTSVTLNAIGLTPGKDVDIQITNLDDLLPAYSKYQTIVSSSAGNVTATFTDLSPNREYRAVVAYVGDEYWITNLDFMTPNVASNISISTSDITTNSVTVNSTGLVSGKKYEIKISNDTSSEFNISITASSTGTGKAVFSNLEPNKNYTASISELNSSGASLGLIKSTPFETLELEVEKKVVNIISSPDSAKNPTTSNPAPNNSGSGSFNSNASSKTDLIPCGTERFADGVKVDGIDVSRQVKNPCGFTDLLIMVNRVIHFVLFVLVVPLAAILFAYAGFMLITSGGEVGKKKKALGVFFNVGLGLVIVAAAWLIISTILALLGFDGSWIGF